MGALVGFAVLLPIAVVLFALAFVGSTAIGIVAAARGLTRSPRPALVPGEDPAHPIYLAGPVLLDVSRLGRTAVQAVYGRLVALPGPTSRDSLFARLWRRQSLRNLEGPLILPPAGLAGGYALGFVTVALLIALTTAVHAALAGLVVLTVRTTALTLRWFEITTLALRGVTTECGTCQQRSVRPAFTCGCGRVHHNLVPGGQGVFRRSCLCGRRLPTLLINGKRTLRADCGLCHAPLPVLAQSLPSVHLPVAGGTATGKSALTHAALARLQHSPTSASVHTLVLGHKHLRRLVHLYDAPGEVFESTEHLTAATFLALAGGIILVVDPFTLPAVSDRVAPHVPTELRPSRTDPKTVLDGVAETLSETRGTAIPLAVVISKADALPTTCHPYTGVTADQSARSRAARQWLIDHGRVDLVNSAHNQFARVRYFVVSDRDADTPAVQDAPESPVLWLLGLHARRR